MGIKGILSMPLLFLALYMGSVAIDNHRMKSQYKIILDAYSSIRRGEEVNLDDVVHDRMSPLERYASKIVYRDRESQTKRRERIIRNRIGIVTLSGSRRRSDYIDELFQQAEDLHRIRRYADEPVFFGISGAVIETRDRENLDKVVDVIYNNDVNHDQSADIARAIGITDDVEFINRFRNLVVERERTSVSRDFARKLYLLSEIGGMASIRLISAFRKEDRLPYATELIRAARTRQEKHWVYNFLRNAYSKHRGPCSRMWSDYEILNRLRKELGIPYSDMNSALRLSSMERPCNYRYAN